MRVSNRPLPFAARSRLWALITTALFPAYAGVAYFFVALPDTDPVVANDVAERLEDQPVTINVRRKDTDADGFYMKYIPATNDPGAHAIQYGIADGHGNSSRASVLVSVCVLAGTPYKAACLQRNARMTIHSAPVYSYLAIGRRSAQECTMFTEQKTAAPFLYTTAPDSRATQRPESGRPTK